ncbi:MAG: Arc family DNA-binding protein [Lachnospiraceae bacterium]|nr:Arc family DNA-binding protein [Lachnospiraceae bacterium]
MFSIYATKNLDKVRWGKYNCITIEYRPFIVVEIGGYGLEERKLIIEPHKYGGETSVISMRMPKEMLEDIDKVAAETGRTRNEILMLSMEFALEHLEIKRKDGGK